MKVTIRWFVWVLAIGSGAVLGIALAGGEAETGEKTPEEWIRLLSDPDWEVRAKATDALREGGEGAYRALFAVQSTDPEAAFRIALLKKELAPLHGSWKHSLEAGRVALDGGEMEQALKYLFIAARKKEILRQDSWIAEMCTRAWQGVEEEEKNRPGRTDWELFLCGEHDYLADRYPDSPIREKALFLSGRFGDVLCDYPHGTYAPLAKYSLTAGHHYYQAIQDPTMRRTGSAGPWRNSTGTPKP
ncbi:MAG: hypothetical protein ACYTFG_16685 [Planctomycetota bacterium]|jgi:hypothetical protein